jgi:hypothetical protein
MMKKPKKPTFRPYLIGIFGIFLLVSVSVFFVGLHNADIGHNVGLLEKTYNIKLTDSSLSDQEVESTQLYLKGMRFMLLAFYLGLASAFGWGMVFYSDSL